MLRNHGHRRTLVVNRASLLRGFLRLQLRLGRALHKVFLQFWFLFDTLDHDLVKRAVRKYTDCRWVLLYVERWLTAPIQREDGTLTARPAGIPQGAS